MKRLSWILAALLPVVAAQAQKLPPGSEILQKVAKGTEGVQDYTVDLLVDVNMDRIRIPRSKATMYFKKPDKVHFESTSISMLPREGMAFNSSAILERYTAETIGTDTVDGLRVIKLQLAAREASARLRQLYAWVDPANWTLRRIQTIPYEGRMLTIDFRFSIHEGTYWLPDSLTARFEALGQPPEMKTGQPATTPDTPMDQMQVRAPRSGSISITYSNYRINTGLSDDMFKPTEKQ